MNGLFKEQKLSDDRTFIAVDAVEQRALLRNDSVGERSRPDDRVDGSVGVQQPDVDASAR